MQSINANSAYMIRIIIVRIQFEQFFLQKYKLGQTLIIISTSWLFLFAYSSLIMALHDCLSK